MSVDESDTDCSDAYDADDEEMDIDVEFEEGEHENPTTPPPNDDGNTSPASSFTELGDKPPVVLRLRGGRMSSRNSQYDLSEAFDLSEDDEEMNIGIPVEDWEYDGPTTLPPSNDIEAPITISTWSMSSDESLLVLGSPDDRPMPARYTDDHSDKVFILHEYDECLNADVDGDAWAIVRPTQQDEGRFLDALGNWP